MPKTARSLADMTYLSALTGCPRLMVNYHHVVFSKVLNFYLNSQGHYLLFKAVSRFQITSGQWGSPFLVRTPKCLWMVAWNSHILTYDLVRD